MADYTLTAAPALGGYEQDFDGVSLAEATGLAIVSIALPFGGEAKAEAALKTAFGTELPPVGKSALSKDGKTRLARLAPDQLFALFDHDTPDAEPQIATKLNGAAYTTDQTDVWVGLTVSGTAARRVLERICPLDLYPTTFAEGDVARTVMEHLGVVILRTGEDSFLLLSASSSAKSFLHAVEMSVSNTT